MFNMNKMARAAVAILISTPLLMASDCEAGRRKKRSPQPAAEVHQAIRRLPTNSIVVGCCGNDCPMNGGNGLMMRGLDIFFAGQFERMKGGNPDADREIDKAVTALRARSGSKLHNHPGMTLDLYPQAEGATGIHVQADWFDYEIEPNTYEAVFFEQLPPTGLVSTHGEHDASRATDDYLPRAIEKARKALRDDGNLVILLALDGLTSSFYTPEDIAQLRALNPFMGRFNEIENLFNALKTQGKEGSKPARATVKFFRDKTAERVRQSKELILDSTSGISQFTTLVADTIEKLLTDTSQVSADDMLNPREKDASDIVMTTTSLLTVFTQRDMMVEYLNTHGFKRAELKWLEAGEHEFNPHAGWFLRAVKDPNYVGASASDGVGASSSAGAPPTSTELAAAEESGASAAS